MRAYPLADTALARRIEGAAVVDRIGYAEAAHQNGVFPAARTLRIGGGVATWLSVGNVVNGSVGLGMSGPVAVEEVDRLVEFFESRGALPTLDICPHADSSLLSALQRRGFALSDFEGVLYQPLPTPRQPRPAPGVRVSVARTQAERSTWADLAARGFSDDKPTAADRALSTSISTRADAIHLIGYLDGQPAGTGMLYLADGVADFSGDSTLPVMRNRGVQSAILAERLRIASRAGCDLAVIGASPGGTSQRNQERAGFRIAYTRATLIRSP